MPNRIKPALKIKSNRTYHYPPSLIDDFDRFLMTDILNVNFNLERIVDWPKYDPNMKIENKTIIRGEIYPINWKSKFSGTDSAMNLRISLSTDLNKGDVLIREDGDIYYVIWDVLKEINNKKTQVQKCNFMAEFKRKTERKVDPVTKKLISHGGEEVIVPSMPVIGSTNTMRFDYEVLQNMPAVMPQHTLLFYLQYNELTKELKMGDTFEWGKDTYRIVDLSMAEIDITKSYGLLTFSAHKEAGGSL